MLGGAERAWLVFALATGMVAIATALYLMRGVLAADTGTDSMREIAAAIQEGAVAFLRRQFKTIADHRHPAVRARVLHRHQGRPPRWDASP